MSRSPTSMPGAKIGSGEEASTGALIKRLLLLTWQYRWGCLRVLAIQVLMITLALSGLGLLGVGIDLIAHHAGIEGAKPPRYPFGLAPPESWSAMTIAVVIALGILVLALLRATLTYLYTMEINKLIQGRIVVDLRASVYNKLQRLSFRFFDANESGSIINRVTQDVQMVRMFVDMVMIALIVLTMTLVFYLLYMVTIHVPLTLACLASTPVLWWLTITFSRRVRPAYMKNRELYDKLVLNVSENAQGVHVVKGFGLEGQQEEQFAKSNDDVTEQQRWIFGQVGWYQPAVMVLTYVNLVVLLGYGGYLTISHLNAPPEIASETGITLGSLIVFATLLQQFSAQVNNVATIANGAQQSLIGARRVFDVLDTPVEITSGSGARRLDRAEGLVEFDHVSFGYERNKPVLHDIELSVKPGQCVALLGATGSGKTTLMSLIPRFYDLQFGRVLVDGIDVKDLDLDDLRRNIGIVFQESFLFSTTVAENIAFGHPDATREQIETAAKIAAAHEFITELPKGYDSVLTESGGNLSGGQRQRLAIARAVLLNPRILLLDDPTAAIDPQTETDIMRAMDNAMEGRTTFLVAHRLSTLRRADLIVVLEKGRIVEVGQHDDLMEFAGHYRTVADLQLPDEQTRAVLAAQGEPVPE